MNNNGQCCVASKRFIAVEAIADEFIQKFKDKLSKMKVGDPMDTATDLGPLSSEDAAVHLADQVKRSVDEGAKVLLGGKRADREGAFMEPTILTDLKPCIAAYYEELFGPVASFYVVKDEQAAIDLANDSDFGLGGSVFTQDIERGKKVADQIDTGMVYINQPTGTQPDLPFGGTKRSGFGRELSALGIQEIVNKKIIRVSKQNDLQQNGGIVGQATGFVVAVLGMKHRQIQLVLNQVMDGVLESAGLELLSVVDDNHRVLVVVVVLETRHSDGSLSVSQCYQNRSALGFFYSLNAEISGG
jgi:delta 1-pyrroline-5-carboxylate dehydrogenase